MQFIRRWAQRHPILLQAILWALPAILAGALLRGLLLRYLPYAYWGSDSNSYFSFAERLLTEGKTSLYDKRRFVYPVLMLPVAVLPGATLHWIAWLQHGLGLLTLVPLAYCVRKIHRHWRWWTIPVTTLYAGLPIILWYEHEMLAENFFFAALIWTIAGWLAWTGATEVKRRSRLWWCFWIPFAIVVLTKPAGRFFWPGVLFAILIVVGWRWIRRREALAIGATAALTLMIGQDTQGSWLLYTSAFPLTKIESAPHAALKREVRDLVIDAREGLDRGEITENKPWKRFLKNPERQEERPLWRDLARDDVHRARVYRELAMEGIRAEPLQFLIIAGQKILLSANPDDFKAERFDQDYTAEKFEHLYERYLTESPWRLRNLFGLSRHEPLPPYDAVKDWITPTGHQTAESWMRSYAEKFEDIVLLVNEPGKEDGVQKLAHFGATPLGWWLLAAVGLSFTPRYFRRLGVWVLVAMSYLFGVFLVGGANPRFFAAVWSIIALLLPLPLDALMSLVRSRSHRSPESGSRASLAEPPESRPPPSLAIHD